MSDVNLIPFDEARQELAEIKSIDEALDFKNKAHRVADYLNERGENLAAANRYNALALEAEKKIVELVDEGQANDEITKQGDNRYSRVDKLSTLEMGLSQRELHRMREHWPDGVTVADLWDWEKQQTTDSKEVSQSAWVRHIKGGRDISAMMTSQSNEWYTTPDIIQLVIDVMGGIDLDPCSNSHKSPNVPAAHHYTAEDDGLILDWFGRVYMNPPYGRVIGDWVDKLVDDYEVGNIDQAIALTPARPDTGWFRRFREYPRCFMFGRVKFNDHENSAPFPTMLVNIGCDNATFNSVMSTVGDIYVRVD